MNNIIEAFVLLLSILFIALALISALQINENSDIVELTKLNDLLKVSLLSDSLSIDEIQHSFEFLFPNRCGVIVFDSYKREINCTNKNKLSKKISKEVFYYSNDKFVKIKVTLFYE